jgi:hypothetical protein
MTKTPLNVNVKNMLATGGSWNGGGGPWWDHVIMSLRPQSAHAQMVLNSSTDGNRSGCCSQHIEHMRFGVALLAPSYRLRELDKKVSMNSAHWVHWQPIQAESVPRQKARQILTFFLGGLIYFWLVVRVIPIPKTGSILQNHEINEGWNF